MKLMRVGDEGHERPATHTAEGRIVDLSDHIDDIDGAFLAGGGIDRVTQMLDSQSQDLREVAPGQRIGPCVARPGKIVCVGLNYADHANEAGLALPDEPILFMKAPNAVVGPDDTVIIPPGADKVDWEVELAVVIGAQARYLPDEAAARTCIAGYAISNDVSERSYQMERGGQWVKGKSCETFNPLGPWLVTADQVDDYFPLTLRLDVDGQAMQRGTTASMIFPPAHLVWYISQFMVLEPGDVINTGTPPGVGSGRTPPRFLKPGAVMEVSITGLGQQRQECRAFSC